MTAQNLCGLLNKIAPIMQYLKKYKIILVSVKFFSDFHSVTWKLFNDDILLMHYMMMCCYGDDSVFDQLGSQSQSTSSNVLGCC